MLKRAAVYVLQRFLSLTWKAIILLVAIKVVEITVVSYLLKKH